MPKKTTKEIITAVAYYRFSSHKQNEQSIEGQRRDCEAYAERNGIKIVREYIDRAVTGKTDSRPSFQQMIKDSSGGTFNACIVWKLDRFARNKYDSAIYKEKLRRNGVKVISAMEPIPDSPEGILMEAVLEGMAAYYSADLAQKMHRGLRESALKLKMLGGTPPLGYKRDSEGKYAIDETNAEKVRLIYKLYLGGMGNAEIVRHLNNLGIRTAAGGEFKPNSIYSILENARYTGTYKYDDIEIPDAIPVIIDKDTFEQVQRMKNKNRTTFRRHYEERKYPLTTKLFCPCCNTMMIGASGYGRKGDKYYYYRCKNRRKNDKCFTKNVRADLIENQVSEALNNMVMTDEVIEQIAERIYKMNEHNRNHSLINSIAAQLNETENGIRNILKAIESGVISSSLTERLSYLETQKIELQYAMEQEKAKAPELSQEQIEFMLHKLRAEWQDKKYTENLVDTFVHKIYYTKNQLIIWLNYTKIGPDDENKELESLIIDSIEVTESGSSNLCYSSPTLVYDASKEPDTTLCRVFFSTFYWRQYPEWRINIMVRVGIVRHAMTDPNTRGECLGLRDVDINANGRIEAGRFAMRYIKKEEDCFECIFSSPLERAVSSARPINLRNCYFRPKRRIVTEHALIERDWGKWEGKTLSEIAEEYPEEYAEFNADKLNYIVPGGEPSSDVQARVNEFLDRILPEYDDTHGICLVTHLGTARHIISHLLGLSPERSWDFWMDNSTAAEVLYDTKTKRGILRKLSWS